MEPVRIIFVISDFELDVKRCARCRNKQQKRHSLLSFPTYCAQLLSVVLQTLCNLRSFYGSPEHFGGHLCWNFVFTTSEQSVHGRNLSHWHEFRGDDIEKLRDYLRSKANTCPCVAAGGNVRLRVPFDWTLLSTCIRHCLTQGAWCDRVAVTPNKSAPRDDHTITNHIVILGGLPGQADVLAEFDGQTGVEKLMRRLLVIGSATGDHGAIQSAVSVFGKRRVSLSLVAFESIEPFVIVPKQNAYAHVVQKAIKRISRGTFTWAPLCHRLYWSEISQLAGRVGSLTEKYFAGLFRRRSHGDDFENRRMFNVQWLCKGHSYDGFCVLTDRSHKAAPNSDTTVADSACFAIGDVSAISKVPSAWLFSCKPFCLGYAVESKQRTSGGHFVGHHVDTGDGTRMRTVLITFMPQSRCFAIVHVDNDATAARTTVDHGQWLAKARRLASTSSYTKQSAHDEFPANWRESLVPTLTECAHVQCSSCPRADQNNCYALYNCSAEEAVREYRRHLKKLFNGTALADGNASDVIQRALSQAGIKLKEFLRDDHLWYGPAQFAKMASTSAHAGRNADGSTTSLPGLSAGLHFQFQTALVLGELESVRTPPLGLQDDNHSATSNNFDDSIFEIANLLRWAIGRYPEAAASATRCLQKRVHAGCRFAELVYAELRRDAVHSLAGASDLSKENQAPAMKRRSLPAGRCSAAQSLLDEYKNYAKRYAAGSTGSNSLRFVNMRAEDWAAADDRCFVPDTPDSCNNVRRPASGEEFSISETPAKAVGSSVPVSSERRAAAEHSASKRAEKVRKLRLKLRKVRREKALCKTPSELHAVFSKELHYQRRLNVLTKASHVKRQLFPEYGQWYSSEETGSSDDTNSKEAD